MGEYENPDGSRVRFTDGDVEKDVADLLAVVQGDFRGTPSMEAEQLKSMLGNLQAGKPLSSVEWSAFDAILARHAAELARFRASPANSAQGFVPIPADATGKGRVSEGAMASAAILLTEPEKARLFALRESLGIKPTPLTTDQRTARKLRERGMPLISHSRSYRPAATYRRRPRTNGR